MGTKELTTIKGFIRCLPNSSLLEEASKVALVTDSGEEYHILHKGVGIDLLEHISANAEITGIVSPLEEGFTIQVRNYSVNDGYDDAWYDDAND